MKSALLWSSVAAAIVFSSGLTSSVDAEEPAGSGQAAVERPPGAPQDVRVTVVTPAGRDERSASVERQQVPLGDGATVTVLRPVVAAGARASGPEQGVRRERPLTWQVAGGGRLWLIDPATNDLRTCALRQTSTVGHKVLRCIKARWR